MSYPAPRYRGDKGVLSATHRKGDQEPDLTYPSTGNTVHYLATGASTNGQLACDVVAAQAAFSSDVLNRGSRSGRATSG